MATRSRDWTRFIGAEIAVKGRGVLAERATRLEGTLLGLDAAGDGVELVRLRLHGGDEIGIPRDQIAAAHVVYRWT